MTSQAFESEEPILNDFLNSCSLFNLFERQFVGTIRIITESALKGFGEDHLRDSKCN